MLVLVLLLVLGAVDIDAVCTAASLAHVLPTRVGVGTDMALNVTATTAFTVVGTHRHCVCTHVHVGVVLVSMAHHYIALPKASMALFQP